MMPSDHTRNTLARQWEMLKCLPAYGSGLSTREILGKLHQAGFEVDMRQVQRDLGELSRIFPLQCNDQSKPYGWRWAEGATTDLHGISISEAISLHIVSDTLQPLLPRSIFTSIEPRLKQAKQKLDALERDNPAARWVNKIRTVLPALPLLPPHIAPDVFECLQDALLGDDQVEVEYTARGKTVKTLQLSPLGFVQRGPVTYLLATALNYSDPRLYAVHRICTAHRLHIPQPPNGNFDIDAFIRSGGMQFGRGETICMEARVKPWLAEILGETPLSPDQTIEEGANGPRLTATVLNTPELAWWILSLGPGIEITQPAELRDRIISRLSETLRLYENSAPRETK